MAEYSKQWCEINDPDDLSYDFDILEEAKQLKPEHYVSLICEGFGFTAIGKDKDGNIILADEISPDNCRFWDVNTNEKLDKDRFRQGLGNVKMAYEEVLSRILKNQ